MNDKIVEKVIVLVTAIYNKHHGGSVKPIKKNMLLRDDIGLDSIDLVVLQIEIEDRFCIRFDPLEDDFSEIFYSIETLCKDLETRINEDNG